MPEELSKSVVTKIIFYFFMLLVSAAGWLLIDKVTAMSNDVKDVKKAFQEIHDSDVQQKYQIENLQIRLKNLDGN